MTDRSGRRVTLELLDRGSCTAAHPAPLLFVHGGYHAAWCWDEHFLAHFAEYGFRATAVSLRGHGASTGTTSVRWCSISDYVDDVCWAAEQLDAPPVVIGHSLGGFVVQKYLERRAVPAAILLASAPPQGVWRSSLRMLRKHPGIVIGSNLTGDSLALMGTPALAREHLFSACTPTEVVTNCLARLGPESIRAPLDALVLKLPRLSRISTDVLVVGADHDGTVARADVLATARAYRTEATFIPEIGHDMMLEPGWRAAASVIIDWLERKRL